MGDSLVPVIVATIGGLAGVIGAIIGLVGNARSNQMNLRIKEIEGEKKDKEIDISKDKALDDLEEKLRSALSAQWEGANRRIQQLERRLGHWERWGRQVMRYLDFVESLLTPQARKAAQAQRPDDPPFYSANGTHELEKE